MKNVKKFRIIKFKSKPILAAKSISKSFDGRIVLRKIDVRFLGNDYKGKDFTGKDLNIPIHYLDRSHGWSTTKFKKLIAASLS